MYEALEAKEKRMLAIPGDTVTLDQNTTIDGSIYLYKRNENTYSITVTALVDIELIENRKRIRVIPLKGRYIPKEGDVIVGIVIDATLSSWIIDINSPYSAILYAYDYIGKNFNPTVENIRRYLDIGDVILAKVVQFERSRGVVLTVQDKGLGKITSGSLVEIEPCKVARVIGKKKSMLNMLIEQTKCEVFVGNNGRILLKCPNLELEYIAILAIKKIENEAHTTGLTERIKDFIIEEKVKRGLIKYEIK